MKKLLAVIILVVSAGAAMAQSKIAHVNSQTLLDTLPSRKAALVKLEEYELSIYTELQEMQLDLQQAYANYDKKMKSGTLSPVLQKAEEEKIMRKEKAFQERQQTAQTDLQSYSSELNAPILKRVQKAIETVSTRKKIDYVIDVTVVLIANGEDITDEVVVELLKLEAAAESN